MSRFGLSAAALLASVVLVAACDNPADTVLDPAANLVVHLATPFADDGAVLITLRGLPDAPMAVTAMDGSVVVYTARIGDTLRIAVFGSITSGPLVEIGPMRASAASLVGGRVDDVATRGNEQRELTGYSLTLHPR